MRVKLIVAICVVALALGVWFYAQRPASPGGTDTAGHRVMIVGIDGLDWGIVDRMIEEGRMPNIDGLRQRGTSGVLHSIYPYLSPSVWTSIATGKTVGKHGIESFAVPNVGEGAAPSGSELRKSKALWQLFSESGRTAGFVGWLVTWPADPVNGYMITSRVLMHLPGHPVLAQGRENLVEKGKLEAGVYPPEAWEDVLGILYGDEGFPDPLIVADDLTTDDLAGLVASRKHLSNSNVSGTLGHVGKFHVGDLNALTLARHFFTARPTDVAAVYFRGTDLISHVCWRYMEPESWNEEIPTALLETFSPTIENYYAAIDSIVGEVLELRADDTVIILCSDHGFAGHHGYPGFKGTVAMGTEMHREEGVIVIEGPGVASGKTVEGASVLDVTPTVLAIAGLPVARDMDGRVLVEALEPSFLRSCPMVYTDTYETGAGEEGQAEPSASPFDDEMVEQMRALGYID